MFLESFCENSETVNGIHYGITKLTGMSMGAYLGVLE